jgi:2-desacetyl-2-hydroxyethyl bacteriochlorophyllide A dehydrogenase
MLSCYFTAEKHLRIEDITMPEPGENEVLVQVVACGVCGTDFHIFNGEAPAIFPLIPGHEFSGKVVSCGNLVKRLNVGDRVAVDPNIPCGYCRFCRAGKINFCENLEAIGVTRNGGFAEYVLVPQSQAYLIPQTLDFRTAAFSEPLSCCVHGMDIIDVKPGEKVLIVGSGTIGLLMLQLVKLSGAGICGVIEPENYKRELAVQYGADFTASPKTNNLQEYIQDTTRGGPDVIIECAGNKDALSLCFQLTKTGTRILLFGLAPESDKISINLQKFLKNELVLKSSLLNPYTFQRAIDLLELKKVGISLFPLHRIGLSVDDLSPVFAGTFSVSSLKNILVPFH